MPNPSTARYPFWTPTPSKEVEKTPLRLVPQALVLDLPRVQPAPTGLVSILDAIWRHAWFYNVPVGSWRRALGAVVAAVLLPLFAVVAVAPMFLIMIPLGFMVAPLVVLALLGVALGRRG